MRRNKKSIWSSRRLSIAISAVIGIFTGFAMLIILAAFTYFLMDSMVFAQYFISASIAIGGFFGGFICGRYRRRKGLAEGMICGFVMFIVIAAAGLTILGKLLSIKKLFLLGIFSAAGGVVGVNTKRPKNLTSD